MVKVKLLLRYCIDFLVGTREWILHFIPTSDMFCHSQAKPSVCFSWRRTVPAMVTNMRHSFGMIRSETS